MTTEPSARGARSPSGHEERTDGDTVIVPTSLPRVGDMYIAASRQRVSYPLDGNDRYSLLEDDSFWFRHRNRCLVALLSKYPPAGIVYDVGGGNGYVSRGLVRAGFPAVVVEPGRRGAENALARGLKPVVCARLEDAGFEPGTLPAVGLFDVLEHVEDDAAFLRTVHEFVRPDGRLYLTVPAFTALWTTRDEEGGHFRRYTAGRLHRLLANAGFAIDFLTHMFSILPLPMLALAALERAGARSSSSLRERREHQVGSRWVRGALEWVLAPEVTAIRRGIVLPVGSSCLAAARRL